MIVQREVHNTDLAKLLQTVDETELTKIFDPYLKKKEKGNLIKTGKHGPFKPFNAIKMKGKGLTASEMVIQDRLILIRKFNPLRTLSNTKKPT